MSRAELMQWIRCFLEMHEWGEVRDPKFRAELTGVGLRYWRQCQHCPRTTYFVN
jgi:hypothetical protein